MYYDKLNWKLNIAKQIERPGSQFFTAGFQKNYNVHERLLWHFCRYRGKLKVPTWNFSPFVTFFFQPKKSGCEASFNQSDSRNNSSLNPNRGPGHQVWHRLKSGIQENCVSCWKKASFLERETKSKRRTPMKKEKERVCVREKLNWKV
jgi:hypothetical protein